MAETNGTPVRKRALITGITGQDGSYLTELLLSKDYEVHGIIRRSSNYNTQRLDHIYIDPHVSSARMKLHYGDLLDSSALRKWMDEIAPDEVYNLGAQSHVGISFESPEFTADVVGTGALRMLEAVRTHCKSTGRLVKYYQAGSSEMFGATPPPQDETTVFHPRSPYAVAKVAAHLYTVNYREAYGMFACNGILFNHESPRRGENFVTRKITRAVGRIKVGLQKKLFLGNLDASRDWGFAGDYVEVSDFAPHFGAFPVSGLLRWFLLPTRIVWYLILVTCLHHQFRLQTHTRILESTCDSQATVEMLISLELNAPLHCRFFVPAIIAAFHFKLELYCLLFRKY